MSEQETAATAVAEPTPLHPEQAEEPSEAIVVRTDIVGPPGPAEWRAMTEQARAICTTEFVPKEMRGSPEKVLAAILTGRELGLGPMAAMQGIRIQDGKPAYDAELMRALVRRRGHEIRAVVKTHRECTVWGRRRDTGEEAEVTWTLEDARIANLIDSIKDDGLPQARSKNGYPLPWEQYPRRMLFARATSELVADLFADVLVGNSYTPEEIGIVSDWNEPTDPEAEARKIESSRLVGIIDLAIEDGRITGDQAAKAAASHGLRTRSEVMAASPDVLQSVLGTLGLDTMASDSSHSPEEPKSEEPTADAEPASLGAQLLAILDAEWEPTAEDQAASGDAGQERELLIGNAAELVEERGWDESKIRAVLGGKTRKAIPKVIAELALVDLRLAVDGIEAAAQREREEAE